MPLYNPPSIPGLAVDSGNVVINENSADQDFRIESDDNTHMLFVDAGNNRVGIGTSTPISSVDIEDGLTTVGAVLTLSTKETTVVDADVIGRINFRAPLETGADALLLLASIHAEADEAFDADQNNTELVFSTASGAAAAERMRLTHDGLLGIGTATPNEMLHLVDSAAASPAILIENTGTNTSEPELIFFRSTTSPAASMDIGHIKWKGKDDGGNVHAYASIFADMLDETGATEDGRLLFNAAQAGTDLVEYMRLGGSELTINDTSKDIDFRVESDNNTHALFVRGSDGKVGIGTSAPDALLHISDATTGDLVIFESTAESSITTDDAPQLVLRSGSSTDGDYIGSIAMSGKTDSGAYANYAKIFGRIDDNANAAKSGGLFAQVMHHNVLKTMLWIEGHPSGTGNMTFNYNDQAFDLNFFVKDQQMQVFQTSTIKTMGSTLRLYQKSGAGATDNDGSGAALDYYLRHSGGSDVHAGRIGVAWEGDTTGTASTQDAFMVFNTALNGTDAERMRITSAGNVGIGTTAPAAPLHITVTGEDEVLRLESTDAGGNVAPVMTFKRTSATPVDGDNIGIIQFLAMNSDTDDGAGTEAEHKFADMYARINDVTTGSEDGEIYFRTLHGGALKRRLDMNALGVVFNEESLDMNFRVESNGNANMLVVDGGTDKVGIGVLAPTATLDVVGDVRFRASVEVCTSDPAPATTESGTVYQFTKGSAGTFTLPANPPVGTQFVLVNGDGQDIVITRPASGVKINGATANKTNTTAYAATSIVAVVTGTNAEWLAFGGI